jgi:predicted ATPase
VRREPELAQLHQWLTKAYNGERQIVFVSGETGIGKTTLVEAFLTSLASRVPGLTSEDHPPSSPHCLGSRLRPLDSGLWVGRGQCIEHYSTGEPYLPILEALEQLCRTAAGHHLIALLHQHAPAWLAQMPTLLRPAERHSLQHELLGTTQERMLREMATLLEVLTAERVLVLWLKDLHWSDCPTLDLLSFLARRQGLARLLVIGTYRLADILRNNHPLYGVKQELQMHRCCEELVLGPLTEEQVGEYLASRFAGETRCAVPLQQLAQWVYQRTEGNPLFMVNLVDAMVAEGVLVRQAGYWELREGRDDVTVDLPMNLRAVSELQLAHLSPEEQQILTVGSVAGMEFSAAAVAAVLNTEVVHVEDTCNTLAQQHLFPQPTGTRLEPERRMAARYRFLHWLDRRALYERVGLARWRQWHRQIGEWKEAAYGARASEIAADPAAHFAHGRDDRRAGQYQRLTAEKAMYQSASPTTTAQAKLHSRSRPRADPRASNRSLRNHGFLPGIWPWLDPAVQYLGLLAGGA